MSVNSESETLLEITALIWTIYSILMMLLLAGSQFSMTHLPLNQIPFFLCVGIDARKLGSDSFFSLWINDEKSYSCAGCN